jgi:hypothetical protein
MFVHGPREELSDDLRARIVRPVRGRLLAVAGRLLAGVLLVSMMFGVLHIFFFSDVDYLAASPGFLLLLFLTYLGVRLVPSDYRASRVAFILGGGGVGAGILGLNGWSSRLEVLGALTGGLVGGLIASGLWSGVIDAVVAGAVLFGGVSGLIGSYPPSEAFGGSMAIPGGLLGASIIRVCRKSGERRMATLFLAAAAAFACLSAFVGRPNGFGGAMTLAGCFAMASVVGINWGPSLSRSADIERCPETALSPPRVGMDDGSLDDQPGAGPVEYRASRRSPGSVGRIMIAVFWCALVLAGLIRDPKGAMDGTSRLLFFVGGPAVGVIFDRRWGGPGIVGGMVGGTVTAFACSAGLYAWLFFNPHLGALPEPLKQIANSAILGATYGVMIGVLIWGVMLTEPRRGRCATIRTRGERSGSAAGDDRARSRPRFQVAVLAAATVYLVEANLEARASDSGYALIVAAWAMLVVAIGFDLVRIPSRRLNNVIGRGRA